MSDKKGSRDISELKARLGLKKGAGTGSTPAAGGTTPAPRANGVVPPPGLNLPPPPGVTPPAPPEPAIPNAAEDPFGAMNAMAARGTVQRAPEIVIVHDGKPVENVGSSSKGAKIARIAVPAVVALGLGIGMGRVSKDANFYNQGLGDLKTLLGDKDKPAPSTLIATKKLVADLEGVLDEMALKTRLHPEPGYEKKLEDLAGKLELNPALVYKAKENAIDPDVAGQIMQFYAGVTELKNMLDAHAKVAKGDVQLIQTGKAKADAASLKDSENAVLAGTARYGVLISAPSSDKDAKDADKSAEFGAKLVEIGPVFCNDKESKTGKCAEGESITGFGQRGEPGGIFNKADLATQGQDSIPAKKLLLLVGNGMRDAMIKGNEASASEVYYVKRLQEIQKRAKKLLDDGNKLESRVQAEASKGSRFSFFL